ncbi:MAG TPA: prepilin-type N-terminal cleavage/methylation domain-containing protein [Planctomycetota bacterium]|nr:prepilin-type N-terminal cleavage/methylation domain-containing protein [Planctomycetota bacterium]HRR81094.1 prepilin-type N-terminal cleavage/methylation domain-containing protein [Planctomycetota bacterium]HRT93470.1 prepilin-type N-terminal cleavage/methylation domain-containing protein [Planctomycetota bacterium]
MRPRRIEWVMLAAQTPATSHRGCVAVPRRPWQHGLTIVELLTVISILTIITSLASPMILQAKHAALARSCASNLRQVHLGVELVRNANYGKLPTCVELDTADNPLKLQNYPLKEDRWWYRKVSAALYPRFGATVMDPLQGAAVPHERYALRCPGSPDPYDQTRVRGAFWKVQGTDKDRVFDNCYGYNNFGFAYNVGDTAKENKCAIGSPAPIDWSCPGNSSYYRDLAISWGVIVGRPRHLYDPSKDSGGMKYCNCDTGLVPRKTWPCAYTRLGEFALVPEAARTMLLMDYVKADVAPNLLNDGLKGPRFRHGGRGNVVFVDGHIGLYSARDFMSEWSEPDHASWGTANAPDAVTRRGRIHWAVLRP